MHLIGRLGRSRVLGIDQDIDPILAPVCDLFRNMVAHMDESHHGQKRGQIRGFMFTCREFDKLDPQAGAAGRHSRHRQTHVRFIPPDIIHQCQQ